MNEQMTKRLPHILIVDDTAENLRIAAETLSPSIACELSFATHGTTVRILLPRQP